jgi:drug/metabolite transporter (DMT)-like permease
MTQTSKPSTNLHMGLTEWALLLLLSILWGGSFFFGKIARAELSAFTIVLFRVGIAAAILLVVAKASGLELPRGLKAWMPYLVMGLLNNVIPFSLIFWGQREIGAGLASVLNASTPLFGAIVAHIFTDEEKLHSNRLVGVLIGMAGVAVLIGAPGLQLGNSTDTARLAGMGAVLLASLSYGLSGTWAKRFRGVPALTTSACQLTCSTLVMAPLVLLFDPPWAQGLPSAKAMLAVLAIAVLCTALAYVIFFTIIRRAGAANVLLVTLLVPFTAAALGIAFLGEQFHATDLAGAALVGLALIVIDGRIFAGLRKRAVAAP